jgi:hypothetical protein
VMEPSAHHAVEAMHLFSSFAFDGDVAVGDVASAIPEAVGDGAGASMDGAGDSFLPDVGFPIITSAISLFKNGKRAAEGKLSVGRAAEHVVTDVGSTATGAWLGTIMIPVPIVGTAVGAWLGRTVGNFFKGRRYREAKEAYDEMFANVSYRSSESVREMYRAYRQRAIEVKTLFLNGCGEVILPSEAPEVSSLVAEIRVSLLREKEDLLRRLDETAKSVLAGASGSWVDQLLGLSIREEGAIWLETDSKAAFKKLWSAYPAASGARTLAFLEDVARSPSLPAGPLERCLSNASTLVSDGIATQLKEFARWSALAVAMKKAATAAILDTMGSESRRHSTLMKSLDARLNPIVEALRREAEALGA